MQGLLSGLPAMLQSLSVSHGRSSRSSATHSPMRTAAITTPAVHAGTELTSRAFHHVSTWTQPVHRGHASLTYREIEDKQRVELWYMPDGKQGLRKLLGSCLCKSQTLSGALRLLSALRIRNRISDHSQAASHLVMKLRSRVVCAVLVDTALLLFLLFSQDSSRQHSSCNLSRPFCSVPYSCQRYERNRQPA